MATFRMDIKFVFLLCLPLLSYPAAAHSSGASVSVLDHGAKADGSTDSSKAFADAWRAACDGSGTMVIPKGDYLVGETVFAGPCKGPVTIQMEGTIKAPLDSSKFHEAEWITFDTITGLTLNGGGTFDGQGEEAWTKHACPQSQAHCPSRAVNLKFKHVTNANLENFSSLNPKGFHMCVNTCENFHVSNVKITAPGTSPNTDGIHISHSKDVSITKTVISTGDDCISIIQGDTNITVSEVTCGPGHGISVGSLGKYKDEKDVHGVYVKNCTLKDTLNGVRVKSWRAAPPSAASDIHFEDIIMESVKNPVLIDQEYCGSGKTCRGNLPSQVKLSNIQFKNIRGTSVSKCAVKMACSSVSPCQNVELFDINLQYVNNGQVAPATSECSNVKVGSGGKLDPKPCSAGAGTPVESEAGAASAADE